MKTLIICAALVGLGLATTVIAHPTDIAFETRGQCEVAYAKSSKLDRERLVSLGFVDNNGAAQSTFKDTFECQYDDEEQAWFIVFLGFPQL
jgi:hypothetical protein